MKSLDFLKLALQNNLVSNLGWIYSAFCVTKEGAQAYLEDPYFLRIVGAHGAYKFVNKEGNLEDLEGTSTAEPLFRFKDRVKVDLTWAPNIKDSVECSIGNLVFNYVSILPSFGPKYPFASGKLAIADHENYIAKRLTDNPEKGKDRDQDKIYVDEYLRFKDTLIFLEQLAPITSWSATRKGISKPEGIDKYRAELLTEYKGRLNDPTVFAEYEGKLKAFDKEYLKDDPAYDTFIKGKVLDISRKKMFLAIGIPERLDLKDPIVPITKTLEEGQPTDPLEYTAVLNGARFGSFSRGAETVKGGTVSKSIIRVGSNFKIDMEDCGTTLGINKTYSKDTINYLVGRTIIEKNNFIFIEKIEQANHYLGKPVLIRSPATCQAGPGDRLCKRCSGAGLSQHKEGIIIPLMEISSIILNQALKAMHGSVLSTAEVDLESALT